MSNQRTKSRGARASRGTAVAPPPPRVVVEPAVDAAKRAARQERQAQARAAAARRRQLQMLRNIGIVAAIVLVIGGIVGYTIWKDANLPGQSVPQQPSPHLVSKDQPHAPYLNDPPTSGPH